MVEEITFDHLSQKLLRKTTAEQLSLDTFPSLAVCFIFNRKYRTNVLVNTVKIRLGSLCPALGSREQGICLMLSCPCVQNPPQSIPLLPGPYSLVPKYNQDKTNNNNNNMKSYIHNPQSWNHKSWFPEQNHLSFSCKQFSKKILKTLSSIFNLLSILSWTREFHGIGIQRMLIIILIHRCAKHAFTTIMF